MDKKQIGTQLGEIFKDIFDLEKTISVEQLRQEDIEDWDSIGHVRLITTIENEFDVKFDLQEAIHLNSFEMALDYLMKSLEKV